MVQDVKSNKQAVQELIGTLISRGERKTRFKHWIFLALLQSRSAVSQLHL